MSQCKVILISQSELPSTKIGSWTVLYKNYLEGNHAIDYIICPKPKSEFASIKYFHTSNHFIDKIKAKLAQKSYLSSLDVLKKVLQKDEKYLIQIIDNFKIVSDLDILLRKIGMRKQCKIQFFYHGFPPYLEQNKSISFFESVDEMVLLTYDSYYAHLKYYSSLPCKFSVLHNAIDKNKFFKIGHEQQEILKSELGLTGKKVFLWCSQDRPKKGLHLILELWKQKQYADSVLLVIGSSRNEIIPGVVFLGRMPNDDLPKYYQVADVYLFPTLCQEGFGLSLIEALSCGCYCIASSVGGVPEVLHYGKYGKLIEKPHFIEEWDVAISNYISNPNDTIELPNELYSFEKWREGMNKIITEAKIFL